MISMSSVLLVNLHINEHKEKLQNLKKKHQFLLLEHFEYIQI